MTKLKLTVLLFLSLYSLAQGTQSSEKEVEVDFKDLEVSESRIFFHNKYSPPFNYGYQSPDPLEEQSSDYMVSETQHLTQQYSPPMVQPYIRPQAMPKMYQQLPMNVPVSYYPTPVQQPANMYANPVQLSSYTSGSQSLEKETAYITANETCINSTLLANIEKLLQKIEPELLELNKTRRVKRRLHEAYV